MGEPLWTPAADAELDEILCYIAIRQRRPETAARLFWEIHDAAESHLKSGSPGHVHPVIPKGLLYFRFKRWLIVYEPTNEGMTVLAWWTRLGTCQVSSSNTSEPRLSSGPAEAEEAHVVALRVVADERVDLVENARTEAVGLD
jgi:plasmid stabilization system protein ParE